MMQIRNQLMPLNYLPPDVADFCSLTKTSAVLVPIRMNGLTSSGHVNCCYPNVCIAMKLFGGSGVAGWMFNPISRTLMPKETLVGFLTGHAVWLNDEGKLSCVTGKSWGKITDATIEIDSQPHICFIVWDQFKEAPLAQPNNLMIVRKVMKKKSVTSIARFYESPKAGLHESFKASLNGKRWRLDRTLNSLSAQRFLVRQYGTTDIHITVKQWEQEGGGFDERSVVTGRTYEEIRDDRLLRRGAIEA